jgi:hypothetical protein
MNRYERVETALMDLKISGFEKFKASDVASRTRMDPAQVARIFQFTKGIKYTRNCNREYTFVENEMIRVDA